MAEKQSPIHGVVVGAGERSYIMRGGQIDVMKNDYGGLEDTGLSFSLTPLSGAAAGRSGTPTLTPSKGLLMNHVSWGGSCTRGACSGTGPVVFALRCERRATSSAIPGSQRPPRTQFFTLLHRTCLHACRRAR